MSNRFTLPVLVAVVVGLSSCGSPPTVQAVKAQQGSIASIFSYTADVQPEWNVSIVPTLAGKVVSVNVKQGQAVNQGDVIAVLDKRPLQDGVTQAQAAVASAQAKLDGLRAGARPEDVTAAQANAAGAQQAAVAAQANVDSAKQKLAAAQAGGRPEAVQQAQAKLDADQAALDKLLAGATQQDQTSAKLAIEQAKDSLYAVQINRDALCAGVSTGQTAPTGAPLNCQAGQAAVLAAQTVVDQANTNQAKLLAPPRPEDVAGARAAVVADQQAVALAKQPNRPEDIAQLQAAVAAAQAQANQAQDGANAQKATAAKAANPSTEQDLEQAQAAVQSAQAGLQSAQTALANATLTAPAAGIISDVSVAAGSLASPTSPIATEIASALEIDSDVAQDQVAQLNVGQPATIQIGCVQVPGKVLVIAPSADPKTRTFTVKVTPNSPSTSLRAGMSVTVQIETVKADNAVLVPRSAVQSRNGQQVVFKAVNGKAVMSAVRTGIGNAAQVQLTDGVQPGDLVVLAGAVVLSDGLPITVASSPPSQSAGAQPGAGAASGPAAAPPCAS